MNKIEETIKVPTNYSIGFRLPNSLYRNTEKHEHSLSGYMMTNELRNWLKENGLVNYRKNYNDVRDFFAASNFVMFVDLEPGFSAMLAENYEVEYYSIAFTHAEDAMAFKLRWL